MSFSHGGPKVEADLLTKQEVEANSDQDQKDYQEQVDTQIKACFTPISVSGSPFFESVMIPRIDGKESDTDSKDSNKKDDKETSLSQSPTASTAASALFDPDQHSPSSFFGSQTFFRPVKEKDTEAYLDPYQCASDPFASISAEDVEEHLKQEQQFKQTNS